MAIVTTEEKIQIVFIIKNDDGTEFRDALYMTPSERASATQEQIDAQIAERHANWKAVVAAPRREPTAEEKAAAEEARVEMLVQEKARIDQELGAVGMVKVAEARTRLGMIETAEELAVK